MNNLLYGYDFFNNACMEPSNLLKTLFYISKTEKISIHCIIV